MPLLISLWHDSLLVCTALQGRTQLRFQGAAAFEKHIFRAAGYKHMYWHHHEQQTSSARAIDTLPLVPSWYAPCEGKRECFL